MNLNEKLFNALTEYRKLLSEADKNPDTANWGDVIFAEQKYNALQAEMDKLINTVEW